MPITMTRRFYKTAAAVHNPDILKTFPEAVKNASDAISSTTPGKYYIVEVVAIVENEKPPIKVTKVRRS